MTFLPLNSLLLWFIATEWKQFFTIYALGFTGVCVAQQIGPIVKEEEEKKNLLTTTMQYTLAKENHITVVVGCRKGQHHQCRPPIT